MTHTPDEDLPLFLKACFRQPTERAPIWMMRQAGRYLPEYRRVRERTTFLGLCKTPELAVEVTLQPVDILGVDAAIIFSDILLIPEAMGMTLTVEEKGGPRLFPPISDKASVERIFQPLPEEAYGFLGEAIGLVRGQLPKNIPLIGFAGSPWTLFAYMIQGEGSKDFEKAKKFIREDKSLAHHLLEKISKAVADSLNYQIACGAQALQIFDSWGGILDQEEFFEFSLGYVEEVIRSLSLYGDPTGGARQGAPRQTAAKRGLPGDAAATGPGGSKQQIPLIFFAKGTGKYLEKIKGCGADVISLDGTVDLAWARKVVHNQVALQGNLDPKVLYSSPLVIRQAVQRIFSEVNPREGFIFNLGHGILPDTPVENAKALIEIVKEESSRDNS